MTKTPYEIFFERFETNPEDFRKDLSGDGSFEYAYQITDLIKFYKNVNENIFIKLFGEQLGKHLMHKFAVSCNRNLLQFFASLSNEYRFFIIYQIKTNEQLYYPI